MSKSSSAPLSWIEKAVLIHTSAMFLGASWIFGGNIEWMRPVLSIWGTLGAVLTLFAFTQPGFRGQSARRKAGWLLPLALFSLLVLSSLMNLSFRPIIAGGELSYIKTSVPHPYLPSTISAPLSLDSWWLGAGIYLSAFNLACALHSRAALRAVFILIAVNTLVLSLFGTIQALSSAGFYFGASQSPNPRFFATFIYYNHWGAFMMLGLGTAVGLLFYLMRRYQGKSLAHSPFGVALLGVLLIATTAPVSASRANTLISAFILMIALVHSLVLIAKSRRRQGRSPWPALSAILLLAILSTSAAGWLSYQSLSERVAETKSVIDHEQSVFGGRAELYRDTWLLAREKPVFGWGLNTYAIGFQQIRPYSYINYSNGNERYYATAHNDWLQSVAETGFVGTTLLVLMGLVPLLSLKKRQWTHPLTAYPLLGCLLVVLYAAFEFPFGNAAFLVTFWILLFATVRYAQLSDLVSRPAHE